MIRLDGQVAIVTGAGGDLGRAHALLLARRGARVVVNDMGEAAAVVATEIVAAGGEAVAAVGSVTDVEFVSRMVTDAHRTWGRVDVLVNNAGILRDRSFARMELDDFRQVIEVHLMGAVICTKAVWGIMRQQAYGRIVMTTSSSGLYGNFGQSNYGAAKMALVGLMQTLGLEGEKYNIRVNCLAPTAATQMMERLMPEETVQRIRPEYVSPAVLGLVHAGAPNRAIIAAGARSFEAARISLTQGVHIEGDVNDLPEALLRRWHEVVDPTGDFVPAHAFEQSRLELEKAGETPVQG